MESTDGPARRHDRSHAHRAAHPDVTHGGPDLPSPTAPQRAPGRPCPSSHMSGNGRSESVVHILHKAPTHRGKIARCRARSNKRTNQTTSWKPRNGRKRIPAPLGIWGGGGGSEDYPKTGKGGQGGKRMVGVGVDVGGCSVPAEDSRRGTKGYVPGSLVVHAGLGCRCHCYC